MLPKAYLTSHSRMSGSSEWLPYCDYLGSEDIYYITIIYHNIEFIIFVYVHIMGKKNKLEGYTKIDKTDSLWDIGFNRYGGSFILAKKMGGN